MADPEEPSLGGSEEPEKTAILILGMHRSGTSSVSGTLTRLGVRAPNTLMSGMPDNVRGHYESTLIASFNDEALACAGSVWNDWRKFDESRIEPSQLEALGEKAVALLKSEFDLAPLIVLKDPRNSRMGPFWARALRKLNYGLRCIIALRSPIEVAASLEKRNGFAPEISSLIWLRHMLDAEAFSRPLPRAIVFWPLFLRDWRAEIEKIGRRLGVAWPNLSAQTEAEIDAYLSDTLRHHVAPDADLSAHSKIAGWVEAAYDCFKVLASEPYSETAARTLGDIAAEMDEASNAFDDLYRLLGRPMDLREGLALNAFSRRRKFAADIDRLEDEVKLFMSLAAE